MSAKPLASRIKTGWAYGIGLLAILGSVFFFHRAASAQAEDPHWSAPVKLGSYTIFPSNPTPAIVADSEGWLHVFWVNRIRAEGDSVIMYTRWDGLEWSEPNDVLLSPDRGQAATRPRAVVDHSGRLHVIWESLDGRIYHSSAPVRRANLAQAWTPPESIAPFPATGHNLTIDAAGRLHAVFLDRATQSPYYTHTDENAQGWTQPVLIAQFNEAELRAEPCISSIVVDGNNRIHTAWRRGAAALDYYARSEDGGKTWTPPLLLGTPPGSATTYHNSPTLAAVGKDEIHLVWLAVYTLREDGSLVAHSRYHQWSRDGGKTWSQMKLIFPGITGHNGPNSLVVDAAGTLHQLTVGGIDPGAAHWLETSRWAGSQWTPVEVIPGSRRVDWQKDGPSGSDMTLSLGNRLEVVWETRDGDIWYAGRTVDAPALAPQPLPAATDEPSGVEKNNFQPAPTPAVPAMQAFPDASGARKDQSFASLALIALAPVAVLWSILFLVKRKPGRR